MADAIEKPETGNQWTVIEQGSSKAFDSMVTVVANSFEIEDEFNKFYNVDNRPRLIQPPYDMKVLERLAQENNTLPACIAAMVSNVDGTGYTFRGPDHEKNGDKEDKKVTELEETFRHIGIDESFITLRRKKRRDEEQTGNAYWEVIRNLKNELVFLKHVEAKMIRLVRLDDPVSVEKSVTRLGKTFTVTLDVRERRYAQLVGGRTLVYFREFGSSRHLNKHTGEWESKDNPVDPRDRASEMLHFKAIPDAHTPYGIPRWISQLPSVLGSRKAEEFNLDFFNNGGIPPAIIFLQGGTLTTNTRKAVNELNIGGAIKKNRLAVLELESTDGSLDKGGAAARATIERFGADRQSDSMFENYDEKCSIRVRRAFRLPPLFMGAADDYNFATSHTSYMVAEQQVFFPERDEFDEIISIRVLPEMGYEGYSLSSKPLTLKNAENLIKGVTTAKSVGGVNPEELIDAVNDATGTNFTYDQKFDQSLMEPEGGEGKGGTPPNPKDLKTPGKPFQVIEGGGKPVTKTDDSVLWIAFDLRDAILAKSAEEIQKNLGLVSELLPEQQEKVRLALSKMVYLTDDPEDLGLSELAGCGAMILAREASEE